MKSGEMVFHDLLSEPKNDEAFLFPPCRDDIVR
jgi:hypothetical protein